MINKIKMARVDIAMLVTRIIIGGIFIFAGWTKVMDMSGTVNSFSMMGIPAFLAYIVSYGELVGGIMVVLGLWSAIATAFLAVVMIVAVCLTVSQGVMMAMLPATMVAGLVAILGAGSGKYRVPTTKFN